MVLYNVACAYSVAGLVDEALQALDQAATRGMRHRSWVENDSEFDNIREDPRFAEILARMDEPA
jgi:adenylate cyclase